jgi:hypothetical protein
VQSGFPFVKSAGWNDVPMIKFNWEIQLENRKICEEENGKKSMRRRVLAFVLGGTRFGKPTRSRGSFSAYCKGNRGNAKAGLRMHAQAGKSE